MMRTPMRTTSKVTAQDTAFLKRLGIAIDSPGLPESDRVRMMKAERDVAFEQADYWMGEARKWKRHWVNVFGFLMVLLVILAGAFVYWLLFTN